MQQYTIPSLYSLPHVLVLANGNFPTTRPALSLIDSWVDASPESDMCLYCCDGGVNKLLKYTSKLPDAVVGDLDSVTILLRERLTGRIHHIPEQNTNDLTKTMHFVTQTLGYRRVTLLGAHGGREDHFMGNMFLMESYAPWVDELVMLTDTGYIRLLSQPASIEVEVGQQVSLFSFSRAPITARGLHWPLEDEALPNLWMGTLNRADESTIYLSSPAPLLVYVKNQYD